MARKIYITLTQELETLSEIQVINIHSEKDGAIRELAERIRYHRNYGWEYIKVKSKADNTEFYYEDKYEHWLCEFVREVEIDDDDEGRIYIATNVHCCDSIDTEVKAFHDKQKAQEQMDRWVIQAQEDGLTIADDYHLTNDKEAVYIGLHDDYRIPSLDEMKEELRVQMAEEIYSFEEECSIAWHYMDINRCPLEVANTRLYNEMVDIITDYINDCEYNSYYEENLFDDMSELI